MASTAARGPGRVEGDARSRSHLPAPAPPSAPPRYRRVARTLAVGSLGSLAVFTLTYAELWARTDQSRHWLPWAVLGIGLLITFHASSGLLTTVGRAIRQEDVAQARSRQLAAHRDRAQEVLARIRDAVIVTDPHGYVVEWNEAAVRTIGLDAGEARGLHCQQALAIRSVDRPLDCREGCALLRQAASTHGDLVGVEVLRDREGGGVQPLLANLGVVRDERGEVIEVVHSLRDISRLREGDDAKTMFLATTSHELRTPLAVIKGFVETLAHRDVDEQTRQIALRTVNQRVDELTAIVDGLLKTSRLERGHLRAHPQLVDLVPIVEEHVSEVRATTGRDLHLVLTSAASVAWADPVAVGTVVDHLLENAIKYSPDGGPVVVRLSSGPGEDRVALIVRDHGIGMDRETAAHCFERFWQAEQGDNRRFGGTGIGLYLVRSLVEAMRGEITVDSRPGEGSTFEVSLRAVPPDEDVEPPRPTVTTARTGSLVDDVLRHTGVKAAS